MAIDPIASKDDFKAALRAYMTANKLDLDEIAAKLGRPRGNIEHWLYNPPTSERWRKKFVNQYPDVFNPKPGAVQPETAGTAAGKETPGLKMRDLSISMKIEQSRSHVAGLAAHLTWFLYEASETERNLFRDELGSAWEHFQQLVRAMHGETAFKIAKNEGRL